MNLRRGLFRLWLLVSAVWIVVGAWLRNIVCEFGLPHYGNGPWCMYQAQDWALHAQTLVMLTGPPALVGLVGWAAAGFVSKDHKSS